MANHFEWGEKYFSQAVAEYLRPFEPLALRAVIAAELVHQAAQAASTPGTQTKPAPESGYGTPALGW